MSHGELVTALRGIEGLVDVGKDPPNFQFRSRPFLHFHAHPDGMYAHVRFGRSGFEPVWSATPLERLALLARVLDHVERLDRTRKTRRSRPSRKR
ncbi:MAG: hypothetical protein ACT4PI_09545 [Actinomycetota bacterium]